MTQKEALEILKMGHNVFVTGAAGSGKTHLLNEYIKYLREHGVGIGVTASTGIAATHMGGMTIHAWSGLGIRNELSEYDIDEITQRSYLWKRFEEAKVLILDEISMLHHFRLDLIDSLARAFKRNGAPFGGMQVVLCGDFFQLPPVARFGEPEAKFAYHSDSWNALDLKICYLEEQHRQKDADYLHILNSIRDNNISERVYELLQSRLNKKPEVGVEPAKLYSHNADVDAENERELQKISGTAYAYNMTSRGGENLVNALKKSCLAPEKLRLKKGARVMFVKNNYEDGYSNGTLGIVAECGGYGIRVRISSGRTIDVKPTSWIVDDNGKKKAEINQYPLRLAWAITIHKSQGLSLDAAEIDLSQSFERGMGYVALSRLRTLGGLCLKGINEVALAVHDEVLEFDKEFREMSEENAEELKKKTTGEISAAQKNFLERNAGGKSGRSKKAKKKDTVLESVELLEQGKSVKEIAKARSLKEETIIHHLEMFQQKNPSAAFENLKKEISAARLKKITEAFVKVGMEGGVYKLNPTKYILGEDYSYEEMRIARILMMA